MGWVPRFLERRSAGGCWRPVLLEHLLGGAGDQFEANAQHLPADQRPMARTLLENKRKAARDKLESRPQAGVRGGGDRSEGRRHFSRRLLDVADPVAELDVRPPVGATLGDAMLSLADQMLGEQYPKHPMFEPRSAQQTSRRSSSTSAKQMGKPDGRIDPVDSGPATAASRGQPTAVGRCCRTTTCSRRRRSLGATSSCAWKGSRAI